MDLALRRPGVAESKSVPLLDQLRNAEFQFGDFLFPWGMVMCVLGFVLAWLVVSIMERKGWTRHVYHLPLFFVALAVFFGCVLGLILAP